MDFTKGKLRTVQQALQYAVMYAKTEAEASNFAQLLVDVEAGMFDEKQREKNFEKYKSLEGCVFHFCGYSPRCEGKCLHSRESK